MAPCGRILRRPVTHPPPALRAAQPQLVTPLSPSCFLPRASEAPRPPGPATSLSLPVRLLRWPLSPDPGVSPELGPSSFSPPAPTPWSSCQSSWLSAPCTPTPAFIIPAPTSSQPQTSQPQSPSLLRCSVSQIANVSKRNWCLPHILRGPNPLCPYSLRRESTCLSGAQAQSLSVAPESFRLSPTPRSIRQGLLPTLPSEHAQHLTAPHRLHSCCWCEPPSVVCSHSFLLMGPPLSS